MPKRTYRRPSHKARLSFNSIGRCDICGVEKPVEIILIGSELKAFCEECLNKLLGRA